MKSVINLNGVWGFKRDNVTSKINVPSNWYLEGHDFAGAAEYERKVKINKMKDKNYFLVFKGVDYFTEAYVNGTLAGKHEGYFQVFRFNITKLLKDGMNEIKVLVNSPKESEEIWPDKKCLIKGIFNHHDARPGSWNKKTGQDGNTGGIWNMTGCGTPVMSLLYTIIPEKRQKQQLPLPCSHTILKALE
jgi:beta-mannosidase